MKRPEKIGKPSIEDPQGGADIELGQPVLKEEFEKESIEATLPVIEEALHEFYNRRAGHDDRASLALQTMRNSKLPYSLAQKELKKGNGAVIALAILESARGEIQYNQSLIESYELESEDTAKNQALEIRRQKNFEQDMHYQEASDILFSHNGYDVPTKQDFIMWLGETKKLIKKSAKEEEEKFRGIGEEDENIGKRIFRSKLLTHVPAIERFETGKETTRDYREIMDVTQSRLLTERDRLGSLLIEYANNSKVKIHDEMAKTLVEVRQTELFLAIAEGERNERIAKKQL